MEQHPEYSQCDLAGATGLSLSLGRTNYVLHALMEKGFLKICRFLMAGNKLTKTTCFLLTPAAILHRMQLTHGYIARKKTEYEALRAELESLRQEALGAFEETHLDTTVKNI